MNMIADKVVVITGGAGYVGEILCHRFSQRDDVAKIIVVDKSPQTDFLKQIPKLVYIEHNLADVGWEEQVQIHQPTVFIHTAWQIRTMYGQSAEQWRWNIDGMKRVLDVVFDSSTIRSFVHFSTAASYSARVDNAITYEFTEAEGLRDDRYPYAHEKKVAEELLLSRFQLQKTQGRAVPQVTVLRPAAITGPRGRYLRVRFGLQSALQGNLSKSFLDRLVTLLTSVMPATPRWVRQFVHEDDVTDIVALSAFTTIAYEYEVFNMVPDTPPVLAKDMAKAVGKRVLPVWPWMTKIAFWFFWHATKGRVPTGPAVWRFYSYPIVMSGKKLATIYQCRYSNIDAITYTNGYYEQYLNEEYKKRKPYNF